MLVHWKYLWLPFSEFSFANLVKVQDCILCTVAPAPQYSEDINRQTSFVSDGVFENG